MNRWAIFSRPRTGRKRIRGSSPTVREAPKGRNPKNVNPESFESRPVIAAIQAILVNYRSSDSYLFTIYYLRFTALEAQPGAAAAPCASKSATGKRLMRMSSEF